MRDEVAEDAKTPEWVTFMLSRVRTRKRTDGKA